MYAEWTKEQLIVQGIQNVFPEERSNISQLTAHTEPFTAPRPWKIVPRGFVLPKSP